MADQTITPKALTANAWTELASGDYEDLTSSNDGVVTVADKDSKYVFHAIDAAGGAVISITYGDGPLAGQGDVDTGTMTINLHNFAVIETARVKWLTGDDKGKIRITTTANVKVACIQIP